MKAGFFRQPRQDNPWPPAGEPVNHVKSPFGLENARRLAKYAVLAAALAGLVAVCPAQRRPRGSTLRIIQLPDPRLIGSESLEQVLGKRQTARWFTGEPLKLADIGQLAWAGLATLERPPRPVTPPQPVVPPRERVRTRQAADEDDYPIKLYLAGQNGLYLYNPDSHSLQQTVDQDVRAHLARATVNPEAVASAGCDILLTSSPRGVAGRPSGKLRQLFLLQAGHVAQNIQLQAVSLGLGSIPIGDFDAGNVRRVCSMLRNLEPVYIIAVGYPTDQPPVRPMQEPGIIPPTAPIPTTPRKAVFIVPAENFQDEELFETRRVLDLAGVQTAVASTKTGLVTGMLGRTAQATVLVNELRVSDCDAIIFVGGPGAAAYFQNPVALAIARDAAANGKVLAAISIAPTILGNAGVLRRVAVTALFSERIALERAGARYTGVPVQRDGQIITATGPLAAAEFGRAIADALAGR